MYCYVDANFAGLWLHENPQYPICTKSMNGPVFFSSNCTILWVSKLQTDISLSSLNSGCVLLSHSVRDLLPLKILIT